MYIVTSTGPYVISWNFRRVKLGHQEYSMREYHQKVVADSFRYGQSRSIVVALPDDGESGLLVCIWGGILKIGKQALTLLIFFCHQWRRSLPAS